MQNAMKKIIAVGCAVALMLSFAACGKKPAEDETTTAPETTVAEETTAAPSTGDETTEAPAPSVDGTISNSSTKDEVAAYYNQVLNAAKKEGKVRGTEQPLGINLTDLGGLSANFVDMLNKAIPGIVEGIFKPGTDKPLPVVNYDDDSKTAGIQLQGSYIKEFKVEDKGDKLVLTIVPNAVKNPSYGADAQGSFFQILGDVQGVVDSISQIKFAADGGLDLNYENGNGVITVDKASGKLVAAEYNMHINITVTNCKALNVISIKKGGLEIDYITKFA